jgi:hypothetical protein
MTLIRPLAACAAGLCVAGLPAGATAAHALGAAGPRAAGKAAPGRTATVGDPHSPGALARAVQDAYAGGARCIVIRPGTYFLPKVGHAALTLDGWKDATLSAYGVTLILTDLAWTHDCFDLNKCTDVTLQGPTLSQNQVTAYQGRVVAVGTTPEGKATCDWRPDKGYPIPPDKEPKGFLGGDVNIVDGQTRLLKTGNGDFYGAQAEAQGDGTFRVHFNQPKLAFGVGDRLVGRYGDAPFKVYLGGSRGCTIKDVTLMRNGFAPIREDGGGGNHYLHCVWALGPRPTGATEAPLVTNAADGMHMIGSYPGPDIEGCVFQGVFLDDCIAIHGGFKTVKSGTGDALICDKDAGPAVIGQPVRISDNKAFFQQATVTAIKDNGDGTTTVTLDRAVDAPTGSKFSNPRQDGADYKIIGCRLGGTRSRGILVKADGGLIRGNVIAGCGQAAISIGPEYYWGEADYAQDVVIEGNTLRGNGIATYGGGAILVHGDGAIGNKNIVIKGNTFSSNYGGDLDLAWADGVSITDNVITGAPVWPATMGTHSSVTLTHCRAVTLRGNTVRNASVYKPDLVAVGADVEGVSNNDSRGIRAASAKTAGTP